MQNIVEVVTKKNRPAALLQFGQGNFLRGFADYMVDVANEKGVCDIGIVMLKNTAGGDVSDFHFQNSIYTVCLRGKKDGRLVEENRIITSVLKTLSCYDDYAAYMKYAECETLRFVVSNTTEAGIVYQPNDRLEDAPPSSFPAKLTQFLYHRYQYFSGDKSKGLIVIATELIEKNGEKLLSFVLETAGNWKLPEEFTNWVESACIFASSLVDRIVTGYPKEPATYFEELGYEDRLIDVAEPFAFWAIEDKNGMVKESFPLHEAGMPVVFTEDIEPYRERKMRILNGAHTASALGAYLMGYNTVFGMMEDKCIRGHIEQLLFNEVIPTLRLEEQALISFANAVIERFENPFLDHSLLSISLYSVSKWKARLLPTLKEYQTTCSRLPSQTVFSFAALLAFYSSITKEGDRYFGRRENGEEYPLNDEDSVLSFFCENSRSDRFVQAVIENSELWEENISAYPGFMELAARYYDDIKANGVRQAMKNSMASRE